MIYTDSRYADGVVALNYNAKAQKTGVTVFRDFPVAYSEFYYYTWTERDRIDLVAQVHLGDSNLWWQIMDYNPELLNPYNIPVGTLMRIPSA